MHFFFPHAKRTDMWICVHLQPTNSRFPPRCRMPTYRKKQKEVHTTVGGKGAVGIPWGCSRLAPSNLEPVWGSPWHSQGALSPPGGGMFSSSNLSDGKSRHFQVVSSLILGKCFVKGSFGKWISIPRWPLIFCSNIGQYAIYTTKKSENVWFGSWKHCQAGNAPGCDWYFGNETCLWSNNFLKNKTPAKPRGCGGFILMLGKLLLLGELNHSGKEDLNWSCMTVTEGWSLSSLTEWIPVEQQKVKRVRACAFHLFVAPL